MGPVPEETVVPGELVTGGRQRLRLTRRAGTSGDWFLLVMVVFMVGWPLVLAVRDPANQVWGVGAAVLFAVFGVALLGSSWYATPAGEGAPGRLTMASSGVPWMPWVMGEGKTVWVENQAKEDGSIVVVRLGAGRRATYVLVVPLREPRPYSLTPESLRALAGALVDPGVVGGREVAGRLVELAGFVEAGGDLREAPILGSGRARVGVRAAVPSSGEGVSSSGGGGPRGGLTRGRAGA